MKKTLKDKLIAEALDFYKISSLLDNEFDDDEFEDEDFTLGDDMDDEMFQDDDMEFNPEDEGEPELEDEGMFEDDDESTPEFEGDEEGMIDDGEENSDKAGMLRSVKGAYMVYKRATPSNNFEELWVYNIGNVKSQTKIRNAILAGTDIDPVTLRSPDNEQMADVWSKGNVQYLHVDGLPN